MDYLLHLSILICIYCILAQTLSLVAGYSGQISLAHAGFYGIGAYTTALLSVNYGIPPLVNLVLAMLLSGFLAYIVARVAVKTVDDYYVIITLGIQVVIFSIMNNWQSVTHGPMGIRSIPAFSVFGIPLESKWSFLVLSVLSVAFVWYVLHNIIKSPFGKVLRALSEDEVYTGSLGKNVGQAKVVSFVISGMLASIAGVLYAHYIGYIDPMSFTLDESIFILSIVIIGGMRNLRGIFLATVFLVLFPELLRFVGFSSAVAATIRQIVYGIALIIVILGKGKARLTSHSEFLQSNSIE